MNSNFSIEHILDLTNYAIYTIITMLLTTFNSKNYYEH